MKKCTHCEIEKEEHEFYKRKDRKTPNSKCNSCVNLIRSETKAKNKEQYKATRRDWYQRNKEKYSKIQCDWQKRNAEKVNESHREYYKKNRDKLLERSKQRTTTEQRKKWHDTYRNTERYTIEHRAHSLLNKYVKCGWIEKSASCQICGSSERIEGHHADYTKPLDVIWVCKWCHAKIHRESGDKNDC